MSRPVSIVLVLVALLAVSCDKNENKNQNKSKNENKNEAGSGEESGESAADAGALEGKWVLTELAGEKPLAGSQISIEFEGSESSGDSGCNSYSGPFSIDVTNNTLSFGEGQMTLMACQGLQEQESRYHDLLSKVTTYSLSGDKLTISGPEGALDFVRHNSREVKDSPLEGGTWSALTFVDGDSVTSVRAGTSIRVSFDAGKISGHAGCNEIMGDYTLTDGELKLVSLGSTEMACPDPDIREQETRALSLFRGMTGHRIEGNRLTLLASEGRELHLETE